MSANCSRRPPKHSRWLQDVSDYRNPATLTQGNKWVKDHTEEYEIGTEQAACEEVLVEEEVSNMAK